jgi:hypothetical protein
VRTKRLGGQGRRGEGDGMKGRSRTSISSALPPMKLDDVATTPEARETAKTRLFRSASSPRPAVAFLDPGEIEVQKDY